MALQQVTYFPTQEVEVWRGSRVPHWRLMKVEEQKIQTIYDLIKIIEDAAKKRIEKILGKKENNFKS